jgi:hypothetical protein
MGIKMESWLLAGWLADSHVVALLLPHVLPRPRAQTQTEFWTSWLLAIGMGIGACVNLFFSTSGLVADDEMRQREQ